MIDNDKNKRPPTIESVLDFENGKEIKSDLFFQKPTDEIFKYRYLLEVAIQKDEPKYVCYFCKQKIKIRGGGETKKVFHFAHLKDSDECHIKTSSQYTKDEIERIKYNGAKESLLHLELKEFIYNSLQTNKLNNKGISEVNIEKIVKSERISKEWKKPDVSAIFNNKKIVLELQLSTTFLSTIASRQSFYESNQTFILWVFSTFETSDDKRKFTQSDVFYSNNRNGFVLNQAAKEQSLNDNDLCLLCIYEKPIRNNLEISFEWQEQIVTISDLTFDFQDFKVYYFNVNQEIDKIKIEIENEKQEIEKRKRELELIEKEKYKAEPKDFYDNDFPEIVPSYKEIDIIDEIIDDENYETELQRVFYKYETEFSVKIEQLFINGYKINIADKEFIKTQYIDLVEKTNHISYNSRAYNLIWLIIISKMQTVDQIKRLSKAPMYKIVTDILSLKLNKIIGYDLQKLIQIVHRVVDSRTEFLDLFLFAADKYNKMLEIKQQDSSDKFKKKLEKYKQNKTEQNLKNNDIFKLIFPDLFDNK